MQRCVVRPLGEAYKLRQQQRRTFLGLQRPPPPPPATMGYLVVQGLAVVLTVDYAIAVVRGEPTTIRVVCQSAGFWNDAPAFERLHGDGDAPGST
ncbi:hypothetical protein BAUCODRAFT_381039 [Baudoinia panamericana UAMH 10762]|uniref:Uncharacterized protein n=1 Tax=Baudoinia panamericana (strain UAMH 10762) TaxID=717646 RepID=M2N492_BAUPA|nr:uncharacterized protein BAUCODRAFT_381039 [Baudoinia panamericana UAMH 10762]EMC98813.1 hypothetical protein BAUCODRAFT_381039 [Baudoinia panamericana UAMH 10762]